MQLDMSIKSIISICTAWVLIQVNSTAQDLLWACPPQVWQAETKKRPNTSRPTNVNGGDMPRCSSGRSAIVWLSLVLCSLLHVTVCGRHCWCVSNNQLAKVQRFIELCMPEMDWKEWTIWTRQVTAFSRESHEEKRSKCSGLSGFPITLVAELTWG